MTLVKEGGVGLKFPVSVAFNALEYFQVSLKVTKHGSVCDFETKLCIDQALIETASRSKTRQQLAEETGE